MGSWEKWYSRQEEEHVQGPRGRNKLEESGRGRFGDVGGGTCRPKEELGCCYHGGRQAPKVVSWAVVWSGSP